MLILNDVHLGVQRKSGVTPASQEALRNWLFRSFEEKLYDSDQDHILILGDLFDQFEIAARDWLHTYKILQDAVVRGKRLTLVAGNHDHSPKAARVSSFEMLCTVLLEQFGPDWVTIVGIDQWARIDRRPDGSTCFDIALAHCSNQDTFDQKLAEVLVVARPGTRVLLHCNFDNNFAARSDHSLNVTREQAYAFKDKGATLYFAHEHQAKTDLGGAVVVFGNQWPTSISDCLNNDEKYAHVFAGGVTKVQTWKRDAEAAFETVPWDVLADYPTDGGAGFIKVVGSATSGEAGAVINAIAKFRQKSSAFVITNGVQIDGIVAAEALPESFEVTKSFDVMQFIKTNLTDAEYAAVEELNKASA